MIVHTRFVGDKAVDHMGYWVEAGLQVERSSLVVEEQDLQGASTTTVGGS